ncbi:aminoacyl-tRNA deacylase [Ferrimonas balearica]|uniref:aminoacyl-tRNA deacylase n=1 Tax=Ferrimonas balearica TaxID=44012 RepID=UPI001C9905B4|nr:YbaK/EbsC family protein [Ferrimonas balearica]MBY5993231.1 YbaK/EbsC family protein [Ferrimonas balearica]
MAVAIRVSDYLKTLGVQYQLVSHPHSQSAMQSAISAGVPARQTAKAVMLEDHEGRRVMAVVPAANRVILHKLNQQLGRELHIVPETKLKDTFDDCELGALPAVGDPYQVQAVYDDQLSDEAEIFMEAGDHENLIRIPKEAFMALVANHQHGRFSVNRAVDYGQPRRGWDWQ